MRKIGEYAHKRWLNKTISMVDMTVKKRSIWDVLYKEGFNYIYSSLKSVDKPVFNMIMTTTNHPSYNIPESMLDIELINKLDKYLDKYYLKDKRHY